jgi:hypothetical protein
VPFDLWVPWAIPGWPRFDNVFCVAHGEWREGNRIDSQRNAPRLGVVNQHLRPSLDFLNICGDAQFSRPGTSGAVFVFIHWFFS